MSNFCDLHGLVNSGFGIGRDTALDCAEANLFSEMVAATGQEFEPSAHNIQKSYSILQELRDLDPRVTDYVHKTS